MRHRLLWYVLLQKYIGQFVHAFHSLCNILRDAVGITAAYVLVNNAQLELVLLVYSMKNMLSSYYCWYIVPTGRYIVPTRSVRVATGRYVVPAVKARFEGNAESKNMRKSMLKQEFLEFRISETEGFYKGYDRMQKILSQLNQLNAKPDTEEINLRFLRALPSSWSQVVLTLKTKGGLEFLSFDDLYNKLKTLEVDVRGYSTFSPSQSARPSHSAFVSATSTNKKMSYGDSPTHSLTTTYSVPSNSKTGSYRTGNVIEDILQLFIADTEPEQQLAYEDLEQIEKLDLEEIDLKWKMATLSVRVHKFKQKAGRKIEFDKKEYARFNKQKVRCYKCQQRDHFARECKSKGGNDKHRYSSFKVKEIGKKEEDSKALITVDTLVDWSNHDSESDEVIAAKEFGMIAGCDSADAIKACANKLYNLMNGANSKEANTPGDAREFALMGVTSEVHNCPFGCDNKYNELTKLLIDSSMSVRTKVGLGFLDYKSQKELGWDDSAFSVFTTTSEDVEGRPTFHRFAKTDSIKAVPPPLTGDYTSLSDHTDLDESQMSYGTKSSTSCEPKSMPNDSVSYDDSDKSSEDNTNDLASSNSGLKSSEHKPTDSSCASTSSVKPVLPGKPKATPFPTGRPKGTPVPTGEPKATPVPTVPTGRYIVPTGRVIVPTGKYIVPTGSVIVATGRH
uniref:CCHC-type domain-containing protein n=1 Tax=Tanacetum cinerariifolium TaxID=118510 RepID=A0A6L2LZE2_TANCI|nr:hypothetical protein [Tanacetum cinerariifolium]